MQSIIDKFSTNFIVAAFIPSLAFVIGMAIIFGPVDLGDSAQRLGLEGFVPVLVFTAIIGFTLSSLNTFIYKTFEGYFLLHHFGFLQRRQQKQARRLQQSLDRKEKRLQKIEARLEKDPASRVIREKLERSRKILDDECYRLAAELDSRYPPLPTLILPTRFGNALRAAEAYPNERYGIDGVPIWPRLVHVIPEKYYEKLETNNNGLAFLLNCSTLSFVAAVLCLLASLHQLYLSFCTANAGKCLLFDPTQVSYPLGLFASTYQGKVITYFILSLLMLILFRAFYNAALPALGRYTNLVRSSYDLFRFELLTALHLAQPKNSNEELDAWKGVSEFITIGRRRGPRHFDYQTPAAVSGEDNI